MSPIERDIFVESMEFDMIRYFERERERERELTSIFVDSQPFPQLRGAHKLFSGKRKDSAQQSYLLYANYS
jgi:hypothetical protein